MSDTRAALEAGKLRDLNLQDQGGINVICGRAPVGMKKFFVKTLFLLLWVLLALHIS